VQDFLNLDNVRMVFGGIIALDGVSFKMPKGKILGLIGPNGAGKTTLFNCISRLYTPTSGGISFQGHDILKLPPHEVALRGMGRTFQNVALFPRLTVLENVMIGGHTVSKSNFWNDAFRLPLNRLNDYKLEAHARNQLSFLGLYDLADKTVADLPFGTQKRVELARALCGDPELLLLDEPAGGLNHDEVYELGRVIKKINAEKGVSVLLVEHHMGLVMSIADQIVALNFGKKLAEGTPEQIQKDPEVIRAYLGEAA
jgi:branched-chain amino acid transport system ATP-binding protein